MIAIVEYIDSIESSPSAAYICYACFHAMFSLLKMCLFLKGHRTSMQISIKCSVAVHCLIFIHEVKGMTNDFHKLVPQNDAHKNPWKQITNCCNHLTHTRKPLCRSAKVKSENPR